MAIQSEQLARAEWGAEKSAAFDRIMDRFWDRAAELATSKGGADPIIRTRIARGKLSEARLDRDECER